MVTSINNIIQTHDGVEIWDNHEYLSFEDVGKWIYELREITQKDIMETLDNGSFSTQIHFCQENKTFERFYTIRLNLNNEGQRRVRLSYLRTLTQVTNKQQQEILQNGKERFDNIISKLRNGIQQDTP